MFYPSRPSALAVLFSFVFLNAASAADLPSGYVPVSGTSSYATSADGGSGTLTASSAVSIGQWNGGFDVAAGKTFTANLPAGGAHLSRDITASPSDIFGTMNVPNGRFFLVNTSGVFFAPGSQVNAAGLVASSLDITNADFTSGNYRFTKASGKPPASVVNGGRIIAGTGGAALLGGAVDNAGMITASTGSILLGSGEAITLDLDSSGLISALVDVPSASAPAGRTDAVRNSGGLTAGRDVTLTAEAADAVFNNLVNHTGLIEAGTAMSAPGNVVVLAKSGRAILGGSVTPGLGGEIRARARVLDLNTPLNGTFSLSAVGNVVNFNREIGGVTPLLSVSAAGGTLRLGRVTTAGTQMYSNTQRIDDEFTGSFLTELYGNLTANGELGSIYLLGAQRMNADITLRTNGASSLIVLGSSQSFTPEWIDGAHTLTLSSANGIDVQADERFGSFYDFGSASAPLERIVIPEARWVQLDNTRLYANTLDITATDVTLFGTFETHGLMDLEATRLDASGFFRTHGGALNMKAASIRLGGEVVTSGGAVALTGPTRFTTANMASGPVLPVVRTGGGSLFVSGPVTLAADTTLQTSGGALTLNSTVNAVNWTADDLRLDAGSGNVTVNGGIGYNSATGAGTRLGRLSVQSARDVVFGSYIGVLSVYQASGTGTTTFRGPVDSYSYIDLNGGHFAFNAPLKTSNGGALTVTNAGTLSTAASADFTLDGAFLQDGAGPSRIAGDIRTSNDNVLFQRSVTLTGDLTIDTGAGAGNISLGNTLIGVSSGQEDLTLHAGTGNITFNGQVGYNPATALGVRIGNLLIRNAFNVTGQSLVTAASIRQLEGTGTTVFRGTLRTNRLPGIELTGNNFNLASMIADVGRILIRYRGFVARTGTATPAPTVVRR